MTGVFVIQVRNIKNVVEHKMEKNLEQELLLAEVIVKVTAMERLLVKAGVFTSEQLVTEMQKISEEVMTFIKANAQQIFGGQNN